MKIIVKNITYIDDGINIPIQLPEELIRSPLFVEIKKRNDLSSTCIFRKEIVPTSTDFILEISSSDFVSAEILNQNEVWDINIKTKTSQLRLLKSNNEMNTRYVKNEWNDFYWKPYWTKDNYLAIFIKYVKSKSPFSIKDIYISNQLYIKVEINEIHSQDEFFFLFNNDLFKETYRINHNIYFEIPINEFTLDKAGRFLAKGMLVTTTKANQTKIILTSEDVQFNIQNEKFNIILSIENGTLNLELTQKKKGITVIGCCATRDNFNSHFNNDYKKEYEFIQLQNQASVISLVSNPISYNSNEINKIDQWVAGQLNSELNKSFFGNQKYGENDYIILDFFSDVYFGVIKIDDAFITNNHWALHKTDLYQNWSSLPTYRLDTDFDIYFELWKKSIHELFKRITIAFPSSKVIVHKARFTDKYIKEDGSIVLFDNAKKVPKYNLLWSILDNYVEENFDTIPISISEEKLISTENHKWGKFNVHYDLPYYHEFLRKLRELSLS
ncbi:DUF6270 domain-containing protein [Peribacillus butanolivorans]|uniref:DUF6270 domain-containing protein n=1 Tax=Peribacillus butanolivorans TaxID=421767 RepID=UPI0036719F3A